MTRRKRWCWPVGRLGCLSAYSQWPVCFLYFCCMSYEIIVYGFYSYVGRWRIHQRNGWGDLHQRTCLVSSAVWIRIKSRFRYVFTFRLITVTYLHILTVRSKMKIFFRALSYNWCFFYFQNIQLGRLFWMLCTQVRVPLIIFNRFGQRKLPRVNSIHRLNFHKANWIEFSKSIDAIIR